jgi:hypothetical protein
MLLQDGPRRERSGMAMRIVKNISVRTVEVLVGYLHLGLFSDAS